MRIRASTAESSERRARGITRSLRGRKAVQNKLKTRPTVTPTLEVIESLANDDAHFGFGSLSMIRRLRGVAEAEESREEMA